MQAAPPSPVPQHWSPEVHFLTVLEAGNSRPSGGLGSVKASSLACWGRLLSLSSHGLPCMSVLNPSFYKDTSHPRLGHCDRLICLTDLFKGTVPNVSHVLGGWALDDECGGPHLVRHSHTGTLEWNSKGSLRHGCQVAEARVQVAEAWVPSG